jgi:hypothetical protein
MICQSAVERKLFPKCTWTCKRSVRNVVCACKESEIWLDCNGCEAWRISNRRGIGIPYYSLKCMASCAACASTVSASIMVLVDRHTCPGLAMSCIGVLSVLCLEWGIGLPLELAKF